uniref:Uncharacterized protein n=1 Tax=Musca domestica TaxID=7370 RepID=A0A1I8NJK5_MUSDO
MEDERGNVFEKVQEIVLRYRATPLANGKSPAELYLGRAFRIKLDTIRPMKEPAGNSNRFNVRQLRVQERWYDRNKPTWKLGMVIRKFGNLHYQIKLDNGYELKRHINQLYKSEVPKLEKCVTFADEVQSKTKPAFDGIRIEQRIVNPINTSVIPQPQVSTPGTPTMLRRSSRTRRPPVHLSDHIQY